MKKYFQSKTIATFIFFLCCAPTNAYVVLPDECRAEKLASCIEKASLSFIFITGEITYEESDFFSVLDSDWDPLKPLPPVYLETDGGSVRAAFLVAHILRSRSTTVITGDPFDKVDRGICRSACVLLAAGAHRRFLSSIGLHSSARVVSRTRSCEILTAVDPEQDRIELGFLREMQIDDEVFNISSRTPFDKMHEIEFDPNSPVEKQLIFRLGFRMKPSESEGELLFKRSQSDGRNYYEKLEKAALRGSKAAVRELIKTNVSIEDGEEPDFEAAIKWSEYGVQLRDEAVMYGYAVALSHSYYGVKDTRRSIELYTIAAKMGHGPAQNNLAWAYYTGEGVQKNISLAVFWISQAAAQDNNFAYGSLCEMHGAGDVFPRDDFEAFKWCKLAIDSMPAGKARGASEAVMRMLMDRMSDRQVERASALALDWRAFKRGAQMGNVEDW